MSSTKISPLNAEEVKNMKGSKGSTSDDVASADSLKEATTSPDSKKGYPSWHNFAAGGFSGAGSRVATAPLDLIRIRRQLTPADLYPSESLWQTWTKIVQNEGGISALFRGNVAAIYLWVGYSAVQFSLYSKTKDHLRSLEASPSVASFWAGAAAGTCATLATYPFDVCRTTFAARGITNAAEETFTQQTGRPVPFSSLVEPNYHQRVSVTHKSAPSAPPKTLTEFALQLYQLKGIRGFYAGAGPAVLQIIPYMGLNFMIYDALVAGDKRVQNSGYAGAISGATSKILVYPIDTVKRRLQGQAFSSAPAPGSRMNRYYTGTVDCVLRVAKEEGITSFYRGVVPSVLKTTIASSLSFALFRFGKNSLEFVHDLVFD